MGLNIDDVIRSFMEKTRCGRKYTSSVVNSSIKGEKKVGIGGDKA